MQRSWSTASWPLTTTNGMPRRELARIVVRRGVDDAVGVEHDQVGEVAALDATPPREAEAPGGRVRHPLDHRLERESAELPAQTAQEARECAVGSGVREAARRRHVAAHHVVRSRQERPCSRGSPAATGRGSAAARRGGRSSAPPPAAAGRGPRPSPAPRAGDVRQAHALEVPVPRQVREHDLRHGSVPCSVDRPRCGGARPDPAGGRGWRRDRPPAPSSAAGSRGSSCRRGTDRRRT